MSNKPFELRPSEFIEFEHVELNAIVDQTDVSVDNALDIDPLSVNFGRRRDCKSTAAERTLAGTTIDWLVAFPADLRPKSLCDRFPHVANRLATDWSHSARSEQSLQVLTGDARWGSAGFPAQVQGELQRMLLQLRGA